MQDLKIILAQVNQFWEDKTANLNHFEHILSEITDTDLIMLPEMFHTAFTMNGAAMAEPMNDSSALRWLKKMSAEKNAAIYTSFIASDGDRLYNRGVFVEPSGEVHIYDKCKLFGLAGEHTIYTPGNAEQIVNYKGWKINLQICYDLRFPENARNGIDKDGKPRYDLLLYVANWPEKRALHWDVLLQARAIENQCYVAGVNRVGVDGHELQYTGGSSVYSPLGETVDTVDKNSEQSKGVVISMKNLVAIRSTFPFLKDNDYRSLFNL